MNFSVYDKNIKDFIFKIKYSKDVFESKNNGDFSMGIKNDFSEDAPKFWPSYINDDLIVGFISPEILSENQLNNLNVKSHHNNILFILNVD